MQILNPNVPTPKPAGSVLQNSELLLSTPRHLGVPSGNLPAWWSPLHDDAAAVCCLHLDDQRHHRGSVEVPLRLRRKSERFLLQCAQ